MIELEHFNTRRVSKNVPANKKNNKTNQYVRSNEKNLDCLGYKG